MRNAAGNLLQRNANIGMLFTAWNPIVSRCILPMLQTVYIVNKKPVEKQAIENARDATVRFEKVTAFKQISQLINTPPQKSRQREDSFFHSSQNYEQKCLSPRKLRSFPEQVL